MNDPCKKLNELKLKEERAKTQLLNAKASLQAELEGLDKKYIKAAANADIDALQEISERKRKIQDMLDNYDAMVEKVSTYTNDDVKAEWATYVKDVHADIDPDTKKLFDLGKELRKQTMKVFGKYQDAFRTMRMLSLYQKDLPNLSYSCDYLQYDVSLGLPDISDYIVFVSKSDLKDYITDNQAIEQFLYGEPLQKFYE